MAGKGLAGRLYRGESSYDFISRRKRWYTVSGFLVLISVAALVFQGLTLGIEFKGGSSFTVRAASVSVEEARAAVKSAGVTGEPVVQQIGDDRIRVQTGALDSSVSNAVQEALAKTFGVSVSAVDTQLIGPSWGEEITKRALYGLIFFLIAMVLYLSFTFEPKMAFAAIIAVLHDVFITVGIYALIGFEVSPATVIGFLTILAYSLYDTVVVFDKVQENTRGLTGGSRMSYSQATNLAVNQTLVRSINTSVVALLPVGSILFVGAGLLGAGTLKDLSLALFIGLIVGTYSSIFIAPTVLAQLREREPQMKALAKRVAVKSSPKTAAVAASAPSSSAASPSAPKSTTATMAPRGPRNQPKRKKPKRK
jgi:preprotein translocase subunit SecF